MKRLFILLLLTIIISGCAPLDDLGRKASNFLPGLDFNSGNNILGESGFITMEILYPSFDEKINIDPTFNEFAPIIRLKNTGSVDARGQLCITGLDTHAFSGITSCECLSYSFYKFPDEPYEPQILTFGPYTISSEASGDFGFTAINRYAYRTQALFNPCIRKDPYDKNECRAQAIETSNGPITITHITEQISPTSAGGVKLTLNIGLKTVAKGKLISESKVLQQCAVDLGSLESAKIQPTISGEIKDLPYASYIRCKDTTLEKGEGLMTCTIGDIKLFDEGGNYLFRTDIQTPSKLELNYAFEEIQSTKFSLTQ